MKHLAVSLYVCCEEENYGKTGEVVSEDPFCDLGLEAGHRGWILSSHCLAAAATRFCHRCGEVSFHRTCPDLSHSTCQDSFAAAHPLQVV